MPTLTAHQLSEACRKPGCPVCRLEGQRVERYLDQHFYENVNSPAWRDRLRASLGFCREHAWLAVDQRLGDPLGFSIIYHDIVNSVLKQLNGRHAPAPRRQISLPGQIPEQVRTFIAKILSVLTPRKRCPVCEHRDEATRAILSALVKELDTPELTNALQASDGLCLPHLRVALEQIQDEAAGGKLLRMHREKLEDLKAELGEFIRKNDYRFSEEGFGSERDAWLRAVDMIAGSRKKT